MRAAKLSIALLILAVGCREGAEPRLERPASGGPTDALTAADQGIPLPELHVVLADPRLSAARERTYSRDFAIAAHSIEDVERSAQLDPTTACAWRYAAGRLHALAGEWEAAAAAFAQVADTTSPAPCPLGGYASLRAAQAHLRLAQAPDALPRARAVPSELV